MNQYVKEAIATATIVAILTTLTILIMIANG